ncbi:VOC family protein [Leifsonia aquatica]|uniref:VOC family protein n=1 Tax=Leifsonia aquatica TaxID=144185 RepID=UPI00046A8A71|nr:VOC family protein [Leifsonia aquatica]
MAAFSDIVIYADDPPALAAFWAAVLEYPEPTLDPEFRAMLLAGGVAEGDLGKRAVAESPDKRGPRLFFHHADGPKDGRNRLHLDVQAAAGRDATDEEVEAEKDRLVALGATVVRLVHQKWGPFQEHYYQLRDPEGNEFCLQ